MTYCGGSFLDSSRAACWLLFFFCKFFCDTRRFEFTCVCFLFRGSENVLHSRAVFLCRPVGLSLFSARSPFSFIEGRDVLLPLVRCLPFCVGTRCFVCSLSAVSIWVFGVRFPFLNDWLSFFSQPRGSRPRCLENAFCPLATATPSITGLEPLPSKTCKDFGCPSRHNQLIRWETVGREPGKCSVENGCLWVKPWLPEATFSYTVAMAMPVRIIPAKLSDAMTLQVGMPVGATFKTDMCPPACAPFQMASDVWQVHGYEVTRDWDASRR